MLAHAKTMASAFGAPFLWLVCFIYFTQGFRSFAWTAVSYQMKDMLKLSPSASQFVTSVAFFPWSIKPLYGIISDSIPIKGRKRVPYLFISTLLSLFPWLILGSVTCIRSSEIYLTILLTIQNLGSAMADVVIDAMIAEAVRSERAAFSGDLQSLSWLSMAFGGICGSLLGGYTLSSFRIETIFLLFSILPSIQLLSCVFVDEIPLVSKTSSTSLDDKNMSEVRLEGKSTILDKKSHQNPKIQSNDIFLEKNKLLVETSKTETLKRRKRSKGTGKELSSMNAGAVEDKHLSIFVRSLRSLRLAFYTLCNAFRQPAILRPMTWFFISHITIPNLSTVMFYYQTEFLKMEASFLGTARVVGWFGLILGTFTYNRYLKHFRLRKILLWTHVGLAFLNLIDIVLVTRTNIQFGLPDRYVVLWGSALADAVNQFKLMPFLIISGQLCPPGIEGTLFALFMSINNFGNNIGSLLGAALASSLKISSDSFDNLPLGVTFQAFSTLIPILFLFLIPKDATGLSA